MTNPNVRNIDGLPAIMGQFDTFARTTMVRAMTATGKAIFRQFRAWSMHRTRACN